MSLDDIARELCSTVEQGFVGSIAFHFPPKGRIRVVVEKKTRHEACVDVTELQTVGSQT